MKIHENIFLRKTELTDLENLFQFQLDEESNYLAAFTPKDPSDKEAYLEKWSKIIVNPAINMQTIVVNDAVIGSIIKFEMDGDAEISYWLDRKQWGKGIVTTALTEFLKTETCRPIHGRVAFDNFGSQRVLEKCGFIKTGNDFGFANARQSEIEEFIYKLDTDS